MPNPIEVSIAASAAIAKLNECNSIGCTEIRKTEIIPVLPFPATFTDGVCDVKNFGYKFKDGATYIVNWDNKEYSCTGQTFTMGETTAVLLGNVSIYGLEDTGEPFLIINDIAHPVLTIVDLANIENTGGSQHTVGVWELGEIIHPIDQKYIPAMDSLTLNGNDDKQYKVTVVDGALTVTAV